MRIDNRIRPESLKIPIEDFLRIAGHKVESLNRSWNPENGSPVFTRKGKYLRQGWTEWTQGFQFGCQILLYDATGEEKFFQMGEENTFRYMTNQLTHHGVHDHGFSHISTHGNLRRIALEGNSPRGTRNLRVYETALRVSGAVQASRWTTLQDGTGFIHSFNGPHSLFSDTVRSCRSLVVAHHLGQVLFSEGEQRISLLRRAVEHLENTREYNVYFGKGRDAYDIPGRVAHESLFNVRTGVYRCPSTQQGYSPFTTWTRGLAWILLGFVEQLEYFSKLPENELEGITRSKRRFVARLRETARVTADFFIRNTARDGIPYWDTGAPGLIHIPNWRKEDSKPDNPYEPVDSSAAVIAAQGLLRLGHFLGKKNEGQRYYQAGLTVARTLFSPRFVSENPKHQGLILHSVYHRPQGWDYIPPGKKVPQGESGMWGDYHAMELALMLKREINGLEYPAFWGPERNPDVSSV